jgi:hypothetical protein
MGLVHVVSMQQHKKNTRYIFNKSLFVSEGSEPLHID